MYVGHREEFQKLTLRVLAPNQSDEGLPLETSALETL